MLLPTGDSPAVPLLLPSPVLVLTLVQLKENNLSLSILLPRKIGLGVDEAGKVCCCFYNFKDDQLSVVLVKDPITGQSVAAAVH